jgi:hypothetical protein
MPVSSGILPSEARAVRRIRPLAAVSRSCAPVGSRALPLSAVRPSPARGHAGQERRSPGRHADTELPQVDKSGFFVNQLLVWPGI